jgi:hypothetical protein
MLDDLSNIIFISDLHAGCRLGLFPPGQIRLDEGVIFQQSLAQEIMWKWWREFWDVWVPDVCKGEPFAVFVNGDSTDGRHHGSVTQISQNLSDQSKIAKIILEPVIDLCQGRFFMIRGTEAHVGVSGENEESLARELGAVPDDEGKYARYEAWIRLKTKYLVHVTHHIGTTGSMHYESTALMRELTDAYVESGRWNDEPPDVVVRSHRHRNSEVRIQTYKGFATVCVTPGWQLRTPFVYKLAGAKMATPQMGGTLVRAGDEDIFTRHFVKTIGRTKEIIL